MEFKFPALSKIKLVDREIRKNNKSIAVFRFNRLIRKLSNYNRKKALIGNTMKGMLYLFSLGNYGAKINRGWIEPDE